MPEKPKSELEAALQGRRVLRSERGASNVEIVQDEAPSTIYIDGVYNMGIGPLVSKLGLYVSEVTLPGEDNIPVEIRRAAAQLVMPTPALIQMCQQILEGTKNFGAVIIQAMDKSKQTVNDILELRDASRH